MTKLQGSTGYLSDILTLISNTSSDEILHYVIHELNSPKTSQKTILASNITFINSSTTITHVWLLGTCKPIYNTLNP